MWKIVPMSIKPLTPTRVAEVTELLGFSAPPPATIDGLTEVYDTWCRRVPFDNVRKLVGLHFKMPELPGIDPADFFAAWQFTGAGSTCWGSNNALHAYLLGIGFDAALISASMFDGDINHGTTVVTIEDIPWMSDTSIHGGLPVPLVEGQAASVDYHGYVTAVRPDPAGWLIDIPTPDPSFRLPCRIHGPMDHPFTREANEKSRESSPFNNTIMAGINDDTGVWMLKDNSLARIDATGTASQALTNAEVDEFLVGTAGLSQPLVAEVRAVLDFQLEQAAQAEQAENPDS
ncbi:MAG: N-hydroxyarylamine O-acetyltransferase [Candidatus Aldehydirespiratoraceae bacterium]|jgi:N-hydroxyarylamine O-acetyltransferase